LLAGTVAVKGKLLEEKAGDPGDGLAYLSTLMIQHSRLQNLGVEEHEVDHKRLSVIMEEGLGGDNHGLCCGQKKQDRILVDKRVDLRVQDWVGAVRNQDAYIRIVGAEEAW